MCLRVLKESNKSRFDRYSCEKQCIDHISYILPFGIVASTCFRQRPITFLAIAVFLDTKIVRSCSTLNTAEYQVPQSHGLVCKRGEHLRCALVFGRVQV